MYLFLAVLLTIVQPRALTSTITVAPHGAVTSIGAAIAQALPGDTIEVQAGVYPEHVVIDKPLTVIGVDNPVIDGGGDGIIVLITAPGVTLRGFTVRNSGRVLEHEDGGIESRAERTVIEGNHLENVLFGIYLNNAAGGIVRGNVVRGMDLPSAHRGDLIRFWYSHDSLLEDNTIENGRDAVIWFSSDVTIRNNVIRDGRYGLHFMFCDNNTLIGNRMEGNSVAIYLMNSKNLKVIGNTMARSRGPSGYGLGLKDMDGVLAEGNRFLDNRVAVYLDSPPTASGLTDQFHLNLFAHNDIGLLFLPHVRGAQLWDNIFWENAEQVAIQGGGELKGNLWQKDGRGNYWSDYTGFDANEDGIGDLAYKSTSLFENLMDRYPGLRLFNLSPASDAVDLAARAFPITQPRPKMTDANPLMTPPAIPAGPGLARPAQGPALAAALGLLALAILILASTQPHDEIRRRLSSFRHRQVTA
ncbi:nitrous oxide reductase family maturation protein NosD [Candidatus Amarolinea aalborgensis]|uniref:nitrous oxide reductase family maturation protein NosD n=1 Tax=Candidatus Amarolinea aalborgensis TaxID=2249329 RepID=UPI003BFA2EB7